ncbi:MAG: twin-arginine translocase subunit TatC [Legionellaceae bacterium]|nr:twin-arginine translocase subunit TatC [Legionellaceae bacterium]
MIPYLLELRKRLLWCLLCFGLFFVFCFYQANSLYLLAVRPLVQQLPEQSTLIATHVTATVLTPLRLAMQLALLFSMPFILWQLWAFIAPGLYRREQKSLRLAIGCSLLLFMLGAAFAYFVALPCLFLFFIQVLPQGVHLLPDISQTLDFIIRILILFGLSFQVPLICTLLTRCNLLTVEQLQSIRPYMIVLAFTLGMLFTPPDVLSQLLLALPLCALYELGICFARYGQTRAELCQTGHSELR